MERKYDKEKSKRTTLTVYTYQTGSDGVPAPVPEVGSGHLHPHCNLLNF